MRSFIYFLTAGFVALSLASCRPPVEHSSSADYPQTDWATPELSSNVWKISKAGQPDSYLVGTIHIGKKGSALSKDAEALLDSVEQLVTETDLLPEQSLQTRQQHQAFVRSAFAGGSLKDKLGAQDFGYLRETFLLNPESAPLADVADKMKPWAAFMFVNSIYPVEYSAESGVDRLLSEAAQKRGRLRLPLETMQQLAGIFAELPEDTVIRFLKMFSEKEAVNKRIHFMFGLYETGRFEELPVFYRQSEQESLTKYPDAAPLMLSWFHNELLFGRNQKWLPQIKAISAEKSTLFAVGIMHLMSEQGLIGLLRQGGYEVTPMPKVVVW